MRPKSTMYGSSGPQQQAQAQRAAIQAMMEQQQGPQASNADVAKGAVGGAASGASTGASVGGPWGALIGGALGGLAGGFGTAIGGKTGEMLKGAPQAVGDIGSLAGKFKKPAPPAK